MLQQLHPGLFFDDNQAPANVTLELWINGSNNTCASDAISGKPVLVVVRDGGIPSLRRVAPIDDAISLAPYRDPDTGEFRSSIRFTPHFSFAPDRAACGIQFALLHDQHRWHIEGGVELAIVVKTPKGFIYNRRSRLPLAGKPYTLPQNVVLIPIGDLELS